MAIVQLKSPLFKLQIFMFCRVWFLVEARRTEPTLGCMASIVTVATRLNLHGKRAELPTKQGAVVRAAASQDRARGNRPPVRESA
jgi:hypothetical protein